jgi:hypothetical protein
MECEGGGVHFAFYEKYISDLLNLLDEINKILQNRVSTVKRP